MSPEPTGVRVKVEGRSLRLSNLEKVYYTKDRFTKGAVIDYYRRVAPVLLPHLRDRPVTLKRYPEGAAGDFFYQKECPEHHPPWLDIAPVASRHRDGPIRYCMLQDLPSLLWAANTGNLELHTFLARHPRVDQPTMLAFDLDPGRPADLLSAADVALRLRGLLDTVGLASYPKTSGAKGVHVYVPLNTVTDFEATKAFARAVARTLARADPEGVTANMRKDLRPGKVFVDWSQNDAHKTTGCVYSLRAKERPTVSAPVTWEEVEEAVQEGDPGPLTWYAWDMPARIEAHGDLFRPVLEQRQTLPEPNA